jgi:hypothetical protein
VSDGTDTEVYMRLNELEIVQGRHDERLRVMDEGVKGLQGSVKELEKVVSRSEVRLTIVISILVFVANYIVKHWG